MRLASLASSLAVLSLLSPAGPALSQSFSETDLVSDVSGRAALTDPDLVNPWGVVPGNGGVFWVSNQATGTSTLYRPDGTKVPLVVHIPGGENTGIVVTSPTAAAFEIPSGDSTARAAFIFVSEGGTISAWASGTNAIQVASTPDANYKGIALAGPRLYAANFAAGTIDVFDRFFHPLTLAGSFVDPNLPAGYGPFNIANIGGRLFIAYAQSNNGDEVTGPSLGFVSVFDADGRFVRRLISNGPLNAPWALVLAPPGFGPFGGKLLVGNFGDGRINAFSLTSGALLGTIESSKGHAIEIEGLWGLHFGRAVSGPAVANRLYFAAGIEDEAHGLFGYLAPVGEQVCSSRTADADRWSELCDGGRGRRVESEGHDSDRKGRDSERRARADSLRALFDCVSSFSRPFGPAGCFTAGCDLLSSRKHLSARESAARTFLALLLDRCAGSLCDSLVVDCREGRDSDPDGVVDPEGRGHKHRDRPTRTVGEIVALIDSSLCKDGKRDFFENLERLAECAIEAGHRQHGHDKDNDDDAHAGSIAQDAAPAGIQVQALGGNPVRLGSGLGARFVVTTRVATTVRLSVYDAAGRLVAEPLRDVSVTGALVVHWDARNTSGSLVSPGTYFYRVVAGAGVTGGRIVVLH